MASADFSVSFPMPRDLGSLIFRQKRRPPRVRRGSFPRLPPDLPLSSPSGYRASLSAARLPHDRRPCIRFLFVGSGFCLQLPSDTASRQSPCLRLTVPTTTACKGLAPSRSTPCLAHRRQYPADVAGYYSRCPSGKSKTIRFISALFLVKFTSKPTWIPVALR